MPNLQEQFRGYTHIEVSKKCRRLNIREDSWVNRARAQRLHLPRRKIGISRVRDLPIKTYHALAWDKREIYVREVRDNSMKLAAWRKRRRGALKRIDAIAHFLCLHHRTNCSQKRSDPYFTLNPHLPRRTYARLCRKPPPRGCINSIRPPVSDGTASRVKTAKWGGEKERRKKISRIILSSFTIFLLSLFPLKASQLLFFLR